jgi:hypothetical protein
MSKWTYSCTKWRSVVSFTLHQKGPPLPTEQVAGWVHSRSRFWGRYESLALTRTGRTFSAQSSNYTAELTDNVYGILFFFNYQYWHSNVSSYDAHRQGLTNNTDPLTAKILHPIILLLEELRRWRLYCVWRYSNGTLKRWVENLWKLQHH